MNTKKEYVKVSLELFKRNALPTVGLAMAAYMISISEDIINILPVVRLYYVTFWAGIYVLIVAFAFDFR